MQVFTVPKSHAEALTIQETLRERLIIHDDFTVANVIAGIDVGYDLEKGLAHSSIVTMLLGDCKPIEKIRVSVPVNFPYIPGLLSFRELPAILAGLLKLALPGFLG